MQTSPIWDFQRAPDVRVRADARWHHFLPIHVFLDNYAAHKQALSANGLLAIPAMTLLA